MRFQANPAAIPFFVAALISLALALFARRRATPIAAAFTLMMAGEAVWAFFEALELVVADLEIKKLCFILRATGSVTMILSLLATVLIFTGRDRWLKTRPFIVVFGPALLLLDDLLDLSRIRQGPLLFERELVDAHRLVHDVVDICRDDLSKARLHVIIDLDAHRHHIDADPIRFQQALWNLIKNAIKFTPANGRLTVRSRNHDPGVTGADAPDLVIEVHDTGIGIDPDVLPRIFDVLEQGGVSTTRRFGGLGLGLTISRSIIEQHGGRLAALSPGASLGSTFTIEMPTASPPAEPALDELPPVVEALSAFYPNTPVKILLVADNVDTVDSLATLLSVRGHLVLTAADMASALRIVRQNDVDVIISDIELPDGSGFDLMLAVNSTRTIPAIALSGFGAPADVEQSHSAGFAVHLTKPVDFGRLEHTIRRLTASAQLTGS